MVLCGTVASINHPADSVWNISIRHPFSLARVRRAAYSLIYLRGTGMLIHNRYHSVRGLVQVWSLEDIRGLLGVCWISNS